MRYYPSPGNNRLQMFPPVIKGLLIANIFVFIVMMLLESGSAVGRILNDVLTASALWPLGSSRFGVWQYFTYMFLHGGFSHIFFNMLALWMFGVELANMWGGRRFLAYYLICGVGAGVLHSIVTLLLGTGAPTVGASGAIMGVMIAFGMTFPSRIIFLFFFPLQARYAVLVMTGIDLYMGITGSPDGVAHFAHLGGAIIGFILLKVGGPLTLGGIFDRIPGFGRKQTLGFMKGSAGPAAPQPGGTVVDAHYRDVERPSPRRHDTHVDLSDDRVNQVLDKMLRLGYRYQDLSEEERAILDNASDQMRRGSRNGI